MNKAFMREAIRISIDKMRRNEGGPFGAVIAQNGRIIARGWNRVPSTNDPTAHAEVVAIRLACRRLKTFHLSDCDLYTSCEPCPMCLAAAYWARVRRIYYANTCKDATDAGFKDDLIYQELRRPIPRRKLMMRQMMRKEALAAFAEWRNKADKVEY